jgi:phage terminase small subunit
MVMTTTVKLFTPKQEMFIAEYLLDCNATQAAIRAGYSPKTANEQGARLLANVSVRQEIDRRLLKRTEKLEVTADAVISELAKMAFANMQDYITIQDGDAFVDLSKLTPDRAAAIQEVTVEEYVEGRGEQKRNGKRTRFARRQEGTTRTAGQNITSTCT